MASLALSAMAVPQEFAPLKKVCREVTPPNADDEIIYEVPDGELTYFSRNCMEFAYDWEGVHRNEIKGSVVRQVKADDGTLYFSNPLADFPMHSYLKGSYDADGSIVIEGPQFIYEEYDDWNEVWISFYIVPMKQVVDESGMATYVATDDMKYVLKKTDNGYEAADPELLLGLASYGELTDMEGNPTGEMGYSWRGFGEYDILFSPREGSNGVTPPAGAAIDKWVFQDEFETTLVDVAFDGDDIYLLGIDRGTEGDWVNGWVKGHISDGKVTIPSGYYIGINEAVSYFSYLWGAKIEYEYDDEGNETAIGSPLEEVVFDYDAEGKKLTLRDGYATCSMPEDFYVLTFYEDVSIYSQNRNVDTPPAKPYDLEVQPWDDYFGAGIMRFWIATVDTDGCLLDTDRLYYRFYINGELFTFTPAEYPNLGIDEDMVNVPYYLYDNWDIFSYYNYRTVYFHFELPAEGCGVQSMYINEEGKELFSEITSSGSGVESTVMQPEETSRAYYNLQGQRVDETYNGPVVCRIVYSDGSVKTVKRMRAGR